MAGEDASALASEPTTALDVTIQAQILEQIQKIQKQTGMAGDDASALRRHGGGVDFYAVL